MRPQQCSRCHHALAYSIVDVPFCRACRRREHDEIDRLVAGERARAQHAHERLLDVAEARAQGEAA